MFRTFTRASVSTLAATGLALLALPGEAGAAQSVGGCQLQGSAAFSPGLSNTAGNFSYSFAGDLSSCQSTEAGAPASGTVEAGKVLTDPTTGEAFQEPVPSGNGTCASGTTSGTAIITWADATHSVISYTTSSAGAAVNLQGTVVPSVTLPAINPQIGQPTSTTVTTTRYLGDAAQGLLAFQADPTQCAGAGVTTAAISGFTGLGSSS
jgi:hypothetical protein